MLKIFSFLKQRKMISAILLFFLLTGIVLPKVARADMLDDIVKWEKDTLKSITGAAENLGLDIIAGTGKFVVGVVVFVEKFAKKIFDSVINADFLKKSITGNKTVIDGWITVRDFSNMFIVLGFVVIGLATILRIREYEAQKLLPTLIIVALLINFSLMICGIIIDGANITMNYFLLGPVAVGGGSVSNIIDPIVSSPKVYQAIDKALKDDPINWQEFAGVVAYACITAGLAAMLFIMYAALFLVRYVALMCLVILSPLAFVCFAFPATKQIWSKWWSQFTQWAIVGIPAGFFIYLASKIAQDRLQSFIANNTLPDNMLDLFIPVAFMYFAYTLTFQISALGAAGAIGAATGAMGFVAGAGARGAKWAGGRAAEISGAKTAAHAITDAGSRMLEFAHLRRAGATSAMRANRVEQAGKDFNHKTMTNAEILSEMRHRGARGASAFKEATSRKILNEYAENNPNQANMLAAVAGRARAWGVDTTDAEKLIPGLSGTNRSVVQRLLNERNPMTGANYTLPDAQVEAVRQRFGRLDSAGIQNLHHSQITTTGSLAMNSRSFDRASINFNANQSAAYKALIPDMTAELAALHAHIVTMPPGPDRNILQRRYDNGARVLAIISQATF